MAAEIYNELPDQYRERVFSLVMDISIWLGISTKMILERNMRRKSILEA